MSYMLRRRLLLAFSQLWVRHGDEGMPPRGGGELTCAEQDDSGASVAPSYDAVEARQGAL